MMKPLIFNTQDVTLTCDKASLFINGTGGPNGCFYLEDMTQDAAKQLIRFIAQNTDLLDPYPKCEVAEHAVINAAMNWYLAGLGTGDDAVVKLEQAATPLRIAVYELRDAKGELG